MWFALAGAVLGGMQSAKANKAASQERIRGLNYAVSSEGENLIMNTRLMEQNRQQLDEELGGILTDNALNTAKNIATANVIASGSGTAGGTTAMASKQAYIDKIEADAEVVRQARNQQNSMLTQMLQDRVNYRNSIISQSFTGLSASAMRTQNLTAGVQGAQTGMQFGQAFSGAGSANTTKTI